MKFVGQQYAVAVRRRPEQLRSAPGLRLCAERQDVDSRRRGHLLHALARHGFRPHRRRLQHRCRACRGRWTAARRSNATLSNPYPQGILTPPGSSHGRYDVPRAAAWARSRAPTARIREMYSWNFSVQREVGWNSMLEINYTGSRGVHLYSPYTSLTPLDPMYWLAPNAPYTRTQLQAAGAESRSTGSSPIRRRPT